MLPRPVHPWTSPEACARLHNDVVVLLPSGADTVLTGAWMSSSSCDIAGMDVGSTGTRTDALDCIVPTSSSSSSGAEIPSRTAAAAGSRRPCPPLRRRRVVAWDPGPDW